MAYGGDESAKELLARMSVDFQDFLANTRQVMAEVKEEVERLGQDIGDSAENATRENASKLLKLFSEYNRLHKAAYAEEIEDAKKAAAEKLKVDRQALVEAAKAKRDAAREARAEADEETKAYQKNLRDRQREADAIDKENGRRTKEETQRVMAQAKLGSEAVDKAEKEKTETVKKEAKDRAAVIARTMQDIIADEKDAAKEKAEYEKGLASNAADMIRANSEVAKKAAKEKADYEKGMADNAAAMIQANTESVKRAAKDATDAKKAEAAADKAIADGIELRINRRKALQAEVNQGLNDAVVATKRVQQAEDELARAEAEHAVAQGRYQAAPGAYTSGNVDTTYQAKIDAAQRLKTAQDDLANATNRASTAQARLDRGTNANTSSTMAFTRSVFFAAQGIEDLQYGFSAVVNNIPMFTMSLAQAAGRSAEAGMAFGAAASLIATGINAVAIPAFEAFYAAMKPVVPKQAAESLKELGERIKELEDKKVRLAVEDDELDAAKEKMDKLIAGQRLLNELLGAQTEKEAATGKAIRQDLIESPGGQEALDKAKNQYVNEELDRNKEYIDQSKGIAEAGKRLARANKAFKDATTVEERDAALQEIQTQKGLISGYGNIQQSRTKEIATHAEGAFGADLDTATGGKGFAQNDAQKRVMERLRGSGHGALADTLAGDISNARSGLGTQAEIEAQGRANAAEVTRKMTKQTQAEEQAALGKDAEFGIKAGNELHTEQDKVARSFLTKMKPELNAMMADMTVAGAGEKAITAAVEKALGEAMQRAGIGNTVGIGAAHRGAGTAVDQFSPTLEGFGKGDNVANAQALIDDNAAKAKAKVEAAAAHAATLARAEVKAGDAAKLAAIESDAKAVDPSMTNEQAHEVAKRTLSLVQKGVDYSNASYMAYMSVLQLVNQLEIQQQQLFAQQQRGMNQMFRMNNRNSGLPRVPRGGR